jgi:hypothetical protein
MEWAKKEDGMEWVVNAGLVDECVGLGWVVLAWFS